MTHGRESRSALRSTRARGVDLAARFKCIATAAALTACGAPAGTHPHDMSTTGHEAAARDEDRESAEHMSQYDPSATIGARSGARGCTEAFTGSCWSWESNPTAGQREQAAQHHRIAEEHRAAAQSLRDAEARACAGISEADRETSPFEHREAIAAVRPTEDGGEAGVTIDLIAVPGLTAQWLQYAIDCHLARNAALGHDVPEMPTCPLVPSGVTATVRVVGDHLAVDVRAESDEGAAEVRTRAARLIAPGSP